MNIILEKHAPTKKEYVRANQAPFITKTLSKEIMKRSNLRKKILSTRCDIDIKAYKKERKKRISKVISTLVRSQIIEFFGKQCN